MKKTIEALMTETGMTITSGQNVNRMMIRPGDAGNGEVVGTIVAKTITNGYLEKKDLVFNEYKEAIPSEKLTREGDVVLKITQPLAACVIGKEDAGYLVSSFCMTIGNIDKDVLIPAYLCAYLNSEVGLAQLSAQMVGSTISTIGIHGLKNIVIPVPSLEAQKAIAEAYEKRAECIQLMSRLAELQKEKLNAMILEADENGK